MQGSLWIYSILSKKKLEKIYPINKGVVAALGGNYATRVIYNKLKIKGYMAHILKSLIFEYYKFPLRKQIKKTRNLLSQDFHS